MLCSRTIKIISAAMLALVLLSAMFSVAFADDGQLIGNFSTEESEGVTTQSSYTQNAEKLITLSDGTVYDPDTELFYCTVENSRFGITVPDGTITTEAVRVVLAPALIGTLYRNGVELVQADISNISEPGKYVLAVTANDSSQTVRVTFTIVTSPTGSIKEYNLPADFFVVSATLNGETASYSRSYVDMTGDGDYEIHYRSPAADKDFYLSVTVDHTPPTATLTGIADGKANEPVTVADVEDGAEIFLDRNGKEIPFNGVIDETGSYVLTVKDEAGNETNYDFVVITYEKTDMKYLIILGVVLLAALAGYFVYYKKNIRVN